MGKYVASKGVSVDSINVVGKGGALALEQMYKNDSGYVITLISEPYFSLAAMNDPLINKSQISVLYYNAYTPSVLLVLANDTSLMTMKDFIKRTEQSSSPVLIGGPVNSAHYLIALELKNNFGYNVDFVPYDDSNMALKALVDGNVTAVIITLLSSATTLLPVRSLAISSLFPFGELPDTPTFLQQGIPISSGTYQEGSYLGFGVPSSVPDAIKQQLTDYFDKITKDRDYLNDARVQGFYLMYLKNEKLIEYQQYLNENIQKSLTSNPKATEYKIPDAEFYSFTIVTATLQLINIFFIAFIIWNREHRVIVAASPLFCIIILIGLMLAYIVVQLNAITPPTIQICIITPYMGHIAFALAIGSFFAKTYRVALIFSMKELRSSRLSNSDLLTRVGAFVFASTTYLILWDVFDAPHLKTTVVDLQIYISCNSYNTVWPNLIIVYEALILCYGIYLSIVTRNNPSIFNESNIMTVILTQLLTFGGLTVFLVNFVLSKPHDITRIENIGIIVVSSIIMFGLFLPKFFVVVLNQKQTRSFEQELDACVVKNTAQPSPHVSRNRTPGKNRSQNSLLVGMTPQHVGKKMEVQKIGSLTASNISGDADIKESINSRNSRNSRDTKEVRTILLKHDTERKDGDGTVKASSCILINRDDRSDHAEHLDSRNGYDIGSCSSCLKLQQELKEIKDLFAIQVKSFEQLRLQLMQPSTKNYTIPSSRVSTDSTNGSLNSIPIGINRSESTETLISTNSTQTSSERTEHENDNSSVVVTT